MSILEFAKIWYGKRMNMPFVAHIVKRVAKDIGAKTTIEPEYGFVGRITFKNGKSTFFRNTCFSINSLGSIEIAKDKGYASFFLKKLGYKVPQWLCVFNPSFNKHLRVKKTIDDGYQFAQKVGFPVIVKPHDQSRGIGVTKVYNKADYYRIAKALFKKYRTIMIQEFCPGNDYRIVVLDDEVISAYQRLPLAVVGDGVSSVKKLLQLKQKEFIKTGRDTIIDFSDNRIGDNLRRKKLSMGSVLKQGLTIKLLDNANLSTGGDAIDCTKTIHPTFKKLAIAITRDMDLRLCGVDIITSDITKQVKKYSIIEINAAPGLDNYASIGKVQQKIVDGLYLKILKALEK